MMMMIMMVIMMMMMTMMMTLRYRVLPPGHELVAVLSLRRRKLVQARIEVRGGSVKRHHVTCGQF